MNYYTGKHSSPNTPPQRDHAKWQAFVAFCKRPIAMIIATAVICASILGGTFMKAFSYRHVDIGKEYTEEELDVNIDLPKGIINIALFGIDTRKTTSFSGNSDSIMILSVNTETAEIKLTSIMRDSLVPIPDYRTTKINAAYARGGAALAIKTLNKTFGLNITEYATVNFVGMAGIIDAIGGITVELSPSEVKYANMHIKYLSYTQKKEPEYIMTAGEQLLTGDQAVGYARIRYTKFGATGANDDYGRTDRHRYIMEQLLNAALKMKPTQYPKLIKTCLPYIETSLSYSEILSYANLLTKDITFKQARIPEQSFIIRSGFRLPSGMSVVYYDLEYASKVLHAFIYDNIDSETYIERHGIEKNDWYKGGGGYSTTTKPSSSKNNSGSVSDIVTSVLGTSSGDIGTESSEIVDVSSDGANSDTSSDIASDVSSGGGGTGDTSSADQPPVESTPSQSEPPAESTPSENTTTQPEGTQ